MNTTDTIIAPATPPGEGGIAIVRISGAEAKSALLHYFRPSSNVIELESHHLYHGILRDSSGAVIDEVMAVYMAAPHTYTCGDVVEIQCHGSQQVVKSILSLYLSHGIRLAHPGEFTFRAYMGGRLDLSQAEAVSSLIHAKTDSARKIALMQMDGALSREVYFFTATLKNILVLVEAWIDFPEEDLPSQDLDKISATISLVKSKILIITESYDYGRVLAEGSSILLVGQPNAGKSSLLNALLGEERAIVTSVPGTTRDFLEEGLTINNVPVRLVDTAGLRVSDDVVEAEGIRRAEKKIALADLVLVVVDASKKFDEQDDYVLRRCAGIPTFLVFTKIDIRFREALASLGDFPTYHVSAKTEEGLDQLREGISAFLTGSFLSSSESVTLTQRRHYEALLFCLDGLERASNSLCGDISLELLAFDLREALYNLGQISGETTSESLLDDIFSGFCIGK